LKVWKNGKIAILEAISAGGKTWTEIRNETSLSRPVISEHLESLRSNGLIVSPLGPKRGSKYEVTPKGQEFLVRERSRQFNEENSLFLSYDLQPEPPEPRKKLARLVEEEVWKDRYALESLALPEHILEGSPTFPAPITALLLMNENGRTAVDPWMYRTLRKYGYTDWETGEPKKEVFDDETDWITEAVASSFADPTIKKLCEVVFERTRVLCDLHSSGEKKSLPTMDNVLNFNFQFSCRYEGEKFLKSASKEERISAQHLLAGMLLLYLGGSAEGPMEGFSWHKEDLEALVESGVLTREEIRPLLEACKPMWRGLRYEEGTDKQKKEWDTTRPGVKGRVSHTRFTRYYPLDEDLTDEQKRNKQYDYPLFENGLTDEQKRQLTVSAYKRFYLSNQQTPEEKQN
jgi:predicted transcriptional regulator